MRRFTSILVIAALLPPLQSALCDDPPATGKTENASELAWLDNLNNAFDTATSSQRLILVELRAKSCEWCAKLDADLAKASMRSELQNWVRVRLDIVESPDLAARLGVAGTPALRLLTAQGRLVDAVDGYLPEPELLEWLKTRRESQSATVDQLLLAEGEPSLLDVVRLVRKFGDREPTVREAAISRLLPHPKPSAAAVIKALRGGNLASRLTALDLLRRWQAPVTSIDPWKPNSPSEQDVKALGEWLESVDEAAAPLAPEILTAAQQADLRRSLARMIEADPHDAAAIRERIVRLGKPALIEVQRQLADVAADSAHERLTALRYRFAATTALVLTWPGGLERLANTDSSVRHQAAEELVAKASADTQPLLLLLFSDPDPLVRELSLQGLQSIGGKKAAQQLVALLDDPEPNVRAAVLKQLTEEAASADADLVKMVADYSRRESDPDLVVYAVRFLRESSGQAFQHLQPLLSHESWRVRAEAAEGVAAKLKQSRYGNNVDTTAVYDSLLKLLEDEDAFVVSRALDGLSQVNAKRAVRPLIQAAEKHPNLAVKIVSTLAQGSAMRKDAIADFRRFFKSDDPSIRAAAVRGLVIADSENAGDIVVAALQDDSETVRGGAAESLIVALESQRPQPRATATGAPPSPDGETVLERWLEQLYSGKYRPAWTTDLAPRLQSMLTADSPIERLSAARALIVLGKHETALPVVSSAASEHPEQYESACKTTAWLLWEDRKQLFGDLNMAAKDDSQREVLIRSMSSIGDWREAELFWSLLEGEGHSPLIARALQDGIEGAYLGASLYYNLESITESKRKRIQQAIAEHQSGSPIQRLVALAISVHFAVEDAQKGAEALMNDESVSGADRLDAFYVHLAANSKVTRRRAALTALSEDNVARRTAALRFLVNGVDSLSTLPNSGLSLRIQDETQFGTTGQPILPEPPRGLKKEHVSGLLNDEDPQTAAYAGYLMSLLGEEEGLAPLLHHWRKAKQNAELDRLVYRACAVLDDSTTSPILKQIYQRLNDYEKSEFYWTIRIMSGREILDLRKQVRRDVGMSNLQ